MHKKDYFMRQRKQERSVVVFCTPKTPPTTMKSSKVLPIVSLGDDCVMVMARGDMRQVLRSLPFSLLLNVFNCMSRTAK